MGMPLTVEQERYWDSDIEKDLQRIRELIAENPDHWARGSLSWGRGLAYDVDPISRIVKWSNTGEVEITYTVHLIPPVSEEARGRIRAARTARLEDDGSASRGG